VAPPLIPQHDQPQPQPTNPTTTMSNSTNAARVAELLEELADAEIARAEITAELGAGARCFGIEPGPLVGIDFRVPMTEEEAEAVLAALAN